MSTISEKICSQFMLTKLMYNSLTVAIQCTTLITHAQQACSLWVDPTINLLSMYLLSSVTIAFLNSYIEMRDSHQLLMRFMNTLWRQTVGQRKGDSWGMCPCLGLGFPHPHQPVWSGHFFTSAPLLHRAPGLQTTHRINPYNKAGG